MWKFASLFYLPFISYCLLLLYICAYMSLVMMFLAHQFVLY
uniref:Uncharacterized protein n=1 Tax=Arundo donax TaxID=35708 RepID=A0A0A8ZQ66_ARUDO